MCIHALHPNRQSSGPSVSLTRKIIEYFFFSRIEVLPFGMIFNDTNRLVWISCINNNPPLWECLGGRIEFSYQSSKYPSLCNILNLLMEDVTSTITCCIFLKKTPKQLYQDQIIEILDRVKARDPKWHEAMVNANTNIFEMTCEESVSYFKRLENLEKIRRTNGPNPSSLPVDNKKSVTSSVGRTSKHHMGSNMWCHYCDKNNHNTVDCRAIAKFKQQKKARFEAKAEPGKKSLASISFLKKLMHLNGNRSLKRLQAVSRGTRKTESILSTEINLTTSSDEGEDA
jgi:hypothetical protein